jgi:hypothetical protein
VCICAPALVLAGAQQAVTRCCSCCCSFVLDTPEAYENSVNNAGPSAKQTLAPTNTDSAAAAAAHLFLQQPPNLLPQPQPARAAAVHSQQQQQHRLQQQRLTCSCSRPPTCLRSNPDKNHSSLNCMPPGAVGSCTNIYCFSY